MTRKIDLREIKALIKESRMEEEYRHKFVENFQDVREDQKELGEQELDALAEAFFKEIFPK